MAESSPKNLREPQDGSVADPNYSQPADLDAELGSSGSDQPPAAASSDSPKAGSSEPPTAGPSESPTAGPSEPPAAPSQPPSAVPSQPPTAGGPPESKGVTLRTASYLFLFIVTIVSLVADLATKAWAKGYFESVGRTVREVVLIPNFMSIIYAKNRGGAWGLLQSESEAIRRPFFLIVSVVAIVFIVSLYRKLAPGQTALKWGLPLVLGGALGNLVDRIRYGFVVDFVDCYLEWGGRVRHWPTFNVADIAICVGVGLMAIDMFTSRKKKPKKPADAPAGAPGAAKADEAPEAFGPTTASALGKDGPEPVGVSAPRSAANGAGAQLPPTEGA